MARIGLGVGIALLAFACATTAPAEKDAREFGYQVSNDVKQVAPGHWTGSWANRGVCLDNVGQKDEEAGVMSAEGTFDGVWTTPTELKSCTTRGKTTCTFQDGSIRSEEWTAECKRGPDGSFNFEGRGVYVKGTGRFEGIQGSASKTGRSLFSPGPGEIGEIGFSIVTAKFTLPKK
jgi:hypothetical protein